MDQTEVTTPLEEYDATPLPPARQTPGLRPALIVLGIALGLVIVFGVASAITDGGSDNTKVLPKAPQRVAGTSLLAVPAVTALKRIAEPGEPPANIVNAVTIPEQASVVGSVNIDQGASQFDRTIRLKVPTNQQAVISFYGTEMRHLGWHVTSSGPAVGQPGIAILGEKGGDDGWEWEMATVVTPTTFAGSHESTAFSVELYQIEDQD
jgi:hypothetical protein